MLLRQLASGSSYVRSLVLGYLDNAKEPQEILHGLRNTEGLDLVIPKTERADNVGALPSVPVVPTQEYGTTLQSEALAADTEYYSMTDSVTADSAFGHPSMIYAPLYHSSNDTGQVPGYTAPIMESVGQINTQQSQIFEPPVPTAAPSGTYTAILPIHDQRTIARQPENRSLFFEPLFNHTDFYLTTVTAGQRTSPQSTTPRDDSFASEYSSSSLDKSISTKPTEELRIQPNVRNHFNNLSLSNSIRVNGYPRHIQDAQIRNIFVPNWAATSLNTVPDPGGLDDAFGDIYQRATGLLNDGAPLTKIFGHHPNIAALYDQQEFDRSCLLSQWAARMVHSVKRKGYDFTCFGSMSVFWYVMRWMVQPSPETYAAMPEWIRPTSNQLFTPHISMADFVLWPGFRELVVQLPQLQERMAWLADMSMYIKCEWPYPLEQALHRNPVSGDVDLVDLAKVSTINPAREWWYLMYGSNMFGLCNVGLSDHLSEDLLPMRIRIF
ncbi:hypothetical protein NW768_008032 [Fusarium equiseti]|uniref:Uncharacterized protein n=1 Tax=Fusarium equiseti TaxID=61235 RepID=A0ABQ8R5X0_FUSEQ|nr:hypothetical protein NW768_008032 [Fusarium equiseti]